MGSLGPDASLEITIPVDAEALAAELPQVNRTLGKAWVPKLVSDADPPRDLNVADED